MRIVGYTDRLSVRAGDSIEFKVSSVDPTYHVQILRLIHGDENPAGPGFKADAVDASVNGPHPGRFQELNTGSHVELEHDDPLRDLRSFTLSAWIFPTALNRGSQAVIGTWSPSGAGASLFVSDTGSLELRLGHRDGRQWSLQQEQPLIPREWQFVAATFDEESGEATLFRRIEAEWPGLRNPVEMIKPVPDWGDNGPSDGPFLIGAHANGEDPGSGPAGHFNGKIEAPQVRSAALSPEGLQEVMGHPAAEEADLVASWDFSLEQSSRAVLDRSPNGLHGRTVNMPTRGVTGHGWARSSVNFSEVPDQYAAIHFHDDDLDDAGWSTDFAWQIPSDLPSGMYAARLSPDDSAEDMVPFFVRPTRGEDHGEILFLVPTFSYLAYANDHGAENPETRESLDIGEDFRYPVQPEDHYILEHGLSGVYDKHTDGSPVVYSSRLRPVMNMRPKYRQPLLNMGRGAPHQLAADLHLIDWLHRFGYGYHVATDEDLHHEGAECLRGYKVVITGTHPEYWSEEGLDALDEYLREGGRLMYMGGNGFYWVTSLDPELGHTIEVRKWGGTSAHEVPAGEVFHSTTGELGGLWRFRGRPPQRLVGVGFSAQAVARNAPYRTLPDSRDDRASFIFEGVDADKLIGDHDSLVNEYGAGGYEIDRYDLELGSPRHTLLLATTTGLPDVYQHVREEIMLANSKQSASVEPRVRADMVYFEGPNDGAVWSAASIAWCGALSYNDYDNAVSRITRNVLEAFLR